MTDECCEVCGWTKYERCFGWLFECPFCERTVCSENCMKWPEEGQVCKECYKKIQEGELSWEEIE